METGSCNCSQVKWDSMCCCCTVLPPRLFEHNESAGVCCHRLTLVVFAAHPWFKWVRFGCCVFLHRFIWVLVMSACLIMLLFFFYWLKRISPGSDSSTTAFMARLYFQPAVSGCVFILITLFQQRTICYRFFFFLTVSQVLLVVNCHFIQQ